LHKTVLENPWIKERPPHLKQALFLANERLECLFGGAAGGGKSSALLMAALQYVTQPGYAGLLLRRTYADLSLPGALMDRAQAWLGGSAAHWFDKSKTWAFPSGATLTFGYLESEADKFRYQGSEFAFIGLDEATQFTESQYLYLFSRLRSKGTATVPLRFRAASNPGGVGHAHIKQRFLTEQHPDRTFVPSRLEDNPSLNQQEYRRSLMNLDPFTRAQLLEGDWSELSGGLFRREWFRVVDAAPRKLKKVRAWDLAASEAKDHTDPDWTVGILLGRDADGIFYVLDVKRQRSTPAAVQALVRQTAELDGRDVAIWIEEEGGSSGKALMEFYHKMLGGWNFRSERPTGDKVTRAAPVSSQAEAGNFRMLRAPWNSAFLDELALFPHGSKDDQVDSLSLGFARLAIIGWRPFDVFV
jgi:predicted phage terminase large subunit-like protein